ncbi:MAG: AraC family ligand binding domain-containing protein, partial [Spirochaetia bacterium]|nr:AraC family ligand binding domain-containing protein [Spirochaetia bacterium]
MSHRIARLTLGQSGPGFFGARAFPGVAQPGLTDWNTHDYFEFAFCFQGKGRYKTLKRKWRFKSGSVIVTNAGEAHCFELEDRVEVYYLQFNKSFTRDVLGQPPRDAGPALFLNDFAEDRFGGCRVIAFSPDEAVDLKRLFESLCRESKLRPVVFVGLRRARVVELIVNCFRGATAPPAAALRKSHSELALDRAL